MQQTVTDSVADSAQMHAASVASYAVSAVNVFFGLTVNEWCMLVGALCAIGTFLINWWYRHKDHKRAERLARVRIRDAERSAASL